MCFLSFSYDGFRKLKVSCKYVQVCANVLQVPVTSQHLFYSILKARTQDAWVLRTGIRGHARISSFLYYPMTVGSLNVQRFNYRCSSPRLSADRHPIERHSVMEHRLLLVCWCPGDQLEAEENFRTAEIRSATCILLLTGFLVLSAIYAYRFVCVIGNTATNHAVSVARFC